MSEQEKIASESDVRSVWKDGFGRAHEVLQTSGAHDFSLIERMVEAEVGLAAAEKERSHVEIDSVARMERRRGAREVGDGKDGLKKRDARCVCLTVSV